MTTTPLHSETASAGKPESYPKTTHERIDSHRTRYTRLLRKSVTQPLNDVEAFDLRESQGALGIDDHFMVQDKQAFHVQDVEGAAVRKRLADLEAEHQAASIELAEHSATADAIIAKNDELKQRVSGLGRQLESARASALGYDNHLASRKDLFGQAG